MGNDIHLKTEITTSKACFDSVGPKALKKNMSLVTLGFHYGVSFI